MREIPGQNLSRLNLFVLPFDIQLFVLIFPFFITVQPLKVASVLARADGCCHHRRFLLFLRQFLYALHNAGLTNRQQPYFLHKDSFLICVFKLFQGLSFCFCEAACPYR